MLKNNNKKDNKAECFKQKVMDRIGIGKEKILLDAASQHPKVLHDPAPFAHMSKMNDSSIDFVLRVWVKSPDYWEVNFDLTEEIYKQLNANGLNILSPQMTVHFADKNQAKLERQD